MLSEVRHCCQFVHCMCTVRCINTVTGVHPYLQGDLVTCNSLVDYILFLWKMCESYYINYLNVYY